MQFDFEEDITSKFQSTLPARGATGMIILLIEK